MGRGGRLAGGNAGGQSAKHAVIPGPAQAGTRNPAFVPANTDFSSALTAAKPEPEIQSFAARPLLDFGFALVRAPE
jgi:hypothetical protein